MKNFAALFALTITLIIIIPSMISLTVNRDGSFIGIYRGEPSDTAVANKIKVYNPETQESSVLSFEEYVKGVVAAEVPASFEEEALKAQAVAARTYAYRRIYNNTVSPDSILEDGKYQIGQAYADPDTLKDRWGDNYSLYWQKISKAVEDTRGEIMIFDDEPIEAVFHSTSAGITEDAVNVWSSDYPYLKSVESKGDEQSPEFISEKRISQTEFISVLTQLYPDISLSSGDLASQITINARTDAGYVDTLTIGGIMLTGRELREALGLRSANFTFTIQGEDIVFETKGYGHGAGMSQYGANAMAKDGHDYQSILNHYYTGIFIIKQEDMN